MVRCAKILLAATLVFSFVSPSKGQDDLSTEAIDRRIIQYRTAEITLVLVRADGQPIKDTDVTIRQVRHKFLFGCNAFAVNPADQSELQQAYQKRFSDLLNFATLPFYWGGYERQEGQTSARRVGAIAQWCKEHGIATKGHPLCWQQVFPRWLMARSLQEIQDLQIGRIGREVSEFAGRIDTWDVVNEAVSMPNYSGEPTRIPELAKKLGRVELIKQTFAAARKANPSATLILNDYDTSANYEKLIKECLGAGVTIDVIGIQSHMHAGYWGKQKAWEVCQRFGKIGKPLNFTETTIISADAKRNQRWNGPAYTDWPTTPEGEARQASQVAEFYTILFSHPAVQAITWWDFSDRGAWLGAPSGLVRKDMSPKPAYDELLKLINGKWRTKEISTKTDENGHVKISGFMGDYALECPQGKAQFRLDKQDVPLKVGLSN